MIKELQRDGWRLKQEAIAFHLDGMSQSGEPIPEPRAYSAHVEIPAEAQ